MSYLKEVKSLLKAVFPDRKVFHNTIPEGMTKPCLSVTEVSNGSSRVLSGGKRAKKTVWRVTVYVKNDSEMQGLLDILETLDNTSNSNFQRIYSNYVLTEKKQSNQILTRAFYDLTLSI